MMKKETSFLYRLESLSNDFRYGVHHVKDQIWIAKHEYRSNALEVFSDIKHVPEFVYHVPDNCSNILLSSAFIMVTTEQAEQSKIVILSRLFSATSFGRQGIKKPDPSKKAEFQTFQLPCGENLVSCYKSVFRRPASWSNAFPYSSAYDEEAELPCFVVVTEFGVLECRPRISPEHYFTELALKTDIEVAEKLGITLDLNMPLLCEFIGDHVMREKEIACAVKFYNLSKCSPTKRATMLVDYSTVTDGLIYIKQVLKKQINSLSSKEKKTLADMAMLCYVEQVMENQKSGTFAKNLYDSFTSFIADNFDYDENTAIELLASNGLVDHLFDVAKTRGCIDKALTLLASRGLFIIPQHIQNMLLDREKASVVCKACDGVFVKHMPPEEATRFLLACAEVTGNLVSQLTRLLPQLEVVTLLQIARVFDPSRQFIKPYLERADGLKKSGSAATLSSVTSSEESSSPSASSIIMMFLKTIIMLSSKRPPSLPDMRLVSSHVTGQLTWSNSLSKRQDSLGSAGELLSSEVARVSLACGRKHIAFITTDRELYTWGVASDGRLGHGDLIEERGCGQPMRVESLHMHGIQVLSVACGVAHTVALCHEGVYSWGGNKYGQLGIGDFRNRSRPFLLSDLSSKLINSIACGSYHTLAITVDHKLFAWGWGIHGQLGIDTVENECSPQQVTFLKDHRVLQVAAGYAHSVVLTSKGVVFTFGGGVYGQLGTGVAVKKTTPQLVESLKTETIFLIACGPFETMAVSDEQTIYCWGRNYHQFHICGKAESARFGRQMAYNTTDISHRYLPEELHFKLQQPITQLFCGNWHYVALTSMNYVYTWGYNDCGQLGHYNKIDQPAPRLVKALSRRTVQGIAVGAEFSVAVDSDDQVLAWGRADGGLVGGETERSPVSPVARRTILSVLAPTPVTGLPIHFDQVSIGSGQNVQRDLVYDQNYDLPDLSSIGQDLAPYSTESVLFSLFKLSGSYKLSVITQYAHNVHQWFVLSFCYELQEEWDQAYVYRTKAIKEHYSKDGTIMDQRAYTDRIYFTVSSLFKKLEDHLAEDVEEDSSIVPMVACFVAILDQWLEENLSFRKLEDILRKHVESLSPLYAIVFFGHVSRPTNVTPVVLRFALYRALQEHTATQFFSNLFFNELLSHIVSHMDTGTNWYSFLTSDTTFHDAEDEHMMGETSLDEARLSRDEMIKEIITHKRKLLNVKSYISLSNAVATTLAAASIAQRVESKGQDFFHQPSKAASGETEMNPDSPDSTVFTCSHNLPRHYILEIVVPEFKSRMGELPEPLHQTADVLANFYCQHEVKIPLACPYCVYNQLRAEQLQLLREAGSELIGDKSSIWEV